MYQVRHQHATAQNFYLNTCAPSIICTVILLLLMMFEWQKSSSIFFFFFFFFLFFFFGFDFSTSSLQYSSLLFSSFFCFNFSSRLQLSVSLFSPKIFFLPYIYLLLSFRSKMSDTHMGFLLFCFVQESSTLHVRFTSPHISFSYLLFIFFYIYIYIERERERERCDSNLNLSCVIYY